MTRLTFLEKVLLYLWHRTHGLGDRRLVRPLIEQKSRPLEVVRKGGGFFLYPKHAKGDQAVWPDPRFFIFRTFQAMRTAYQQAGS